MTCGWSSSWQGDSWSDAADRAYSDPVDWLWWESRWLTTYKLWFILFHPTYLHKEHFLLLLGVTLRSLPASWKENRVEYVRSISNIDSYCAHSDVWGRKEPAVCSSVDTRLRFCATGGIDTDRKLHVCHVGRLYSAGETTYNLCLPLHVSLLVFLSSSLVGYTVLLMSSIGADLSE